MKKNFTSIMKMLCASVLFFSAAEIAFAFPTVAELSGTYKFSATKAPAEFASEYKSMYEALPEEFEFEITPAGTGSIGLTNFLNLDNISNSYTQSEGEIRFDRMYCGTTYYIAPESNAEGYNDYKYWYVSEDGSSITIGNFYVTEYNLDEPVALFTNITVTRVTGDIDEASLVVSNIVGTPDYTTGTVAITFDVEAQNLDEGDYTYQVVLSDATAEADTEEVITLDATVNDGKGTATLSNVKLSAGSYSYNFTVNAFDADELVATSSNSDDSPVLTFTLTQDLDSTTGLNTIYVEAPEARYFSIRGSELTNPAKGQIVIRVQNGKSEKIVM